MTPFISIEKPLLHVLVFYGDLVNEFKRIVGKPIFTDQFKRIIKRYIRAATWDFQQCGICDQQILRLTCAYAQHDQSLC